MWGWVLYKNGLIKWGQERENIFSVTNIFDDLYLSKKIIILKVFLT